MPYMLKLELWFILCIKEITLINTNLHAHPYEYTKYINIHNHI